MHASKVVFFLATVSLVMIRATSGQATYECTCDRATKDEMEEICKLASGVLQGDSCTLTYTDTFTEDCKELDFFATAKCKPIAK